ncbi:MAG: GNAT family N-acetyltransferase [Candidatus Thorarchaeota archaeon]
MTDSISIHDLERIASESWVSRERSRLGGWLLRANDGVTRRANSVLPLGSPDCELEHAYERVVEFYKSRSLEPRFQMTKISQPAGLDKYLASRGWVYELESLIEVSPIMTMLEKPSKIQVNLLSMPTSEWMDAYIFASGHKDTDSNIRKELMHRSSLRKVFAAGMIDDTIAGVGIGVLSGNWIGLFSINTISDYRRRDVATSVSKMIGSWGLENGATHSYLQVESSNEPAKKMYARLGFIQHYKYWYRQLKKEKQ